MLAAAWTVAAESGAPLAASLRDLAAVLRDEAQLRREVGAALAGPAASARLVMALPVIAVVFGATLGFDTFGVLFGNPLGLVCLVVGRAVPLGRAAVEPPARRHGVAVDGPTPDSSSSCSRSRCRAAPRSSARATSPVV